MWITATIRKTQLDLTPESKGFPSTRAMAVGMNLRRLIWKCRGRVLRGPCASIGHRYRAVASWSRVQGVGIPVVTAIKIISIWVLSIILAVPEALGFTIISFNHRNITYRTCMLQPKSPFMKVRWIQGYIS